ncbi:hypothetical protein MPRF_26330 [Mycolicibacterium parafortuitum]|uniref:Uncharacterized protein n=1 Tax=Mycolicibacterium parafortuitum TaxID=39692 RepID=A0A7I7U310_MYCPF|nr:hypothetical protein [Mycolicibacterium parafortuitum]BBY75734.1 hypothetical protein MPRF_26330 [Mycolicibacterium parafortuitum]
MFPTDDLTLTALEHALNTCRGEGRKLVAIVPTRDGGEYNLNQLLSFMSGDERDAATGWPIYYCEKDVIRALVARVRELEAQLAAKV